MKAKLTAFLEQLITYDYLLFGAALLLFVLLLLLAIIMHRRHLLSALLVLLAFATILLTPTVGYLQMHAYLFKNSTTITNVKALEFTKALIVYGEVSNESKRDFTECTVTAGVYKVANNPVLDILYPLNPFKKESLKTDAIASGESKSFKLIVEPFSYERDYNVSIGAKCR